MTKILNFLSCTGSIFMVTSSFSLAQDPAAPPPPSPAIQVTNPYWPMANQAVKGVVALPEAELLTEQHGNNAFWLTWGLTSPHSTFPNRDSLREKLLQVWDTAAVRLRQGNANSGNMWNLLAALDSLLMLEKRKAIPQDRINEWKEALRPPVDTMREEVGSKSDLNWATKSAFQYPNMDAQVAAIMAAASLVFQDQKYAETAKAFAHGMRDYLYAPGEWRYYRDSTPIPIYHGTELMYLGRYYQLLRDPEAAKLIRATKDYYPYVFETENAAEYTSAPWWKQMWHSLGAQYHATEIAALLCGDGRNRWYADQRAKRFHPYYWVAYAGDAWEEGAATRVAPEPPPETFLIDAPSVTGLRGRFGKFSFVGSRGKQAMGFGGCMMVDRSIDALHYDGYLQFARMGITIPGKEQLPYLQRLLLLPDSSQAPVPGGHVIGEGFAALTARFQPAPPTIDPNPEQALQSDWEILERWLFTPNGIVGVLEAKALKDQPIGLPEGILRLGPLARPHEWNPDGAFHVGNLHGRFLAMSGFTLSSTESEDINQKEKRWELQLRLASPPTTIKAGETWSFAVALFPKPDATAKIVKNDDETLVVTLDGTDYRLSAPGKDQIQVTKISTHPTSAL
jgi:hypothetical protein